MFQSTHPHGVRLEKHQNGRRFKVSIHAPARGATWCMCDETGEKGFNPRTRTGCDFNIVTDEPEIIVSIHAPARGATSDFRNEN